MEQLKDRMKYIAIPLISIFCLAVFGPVKNGISEEALQKKQEPVPRQDTDWSKDISDKIDRTIQVLDVVKEELKEIKKSDKLEAIGKQQSAGGEKETSWADAIRGKLSAAVRIWRKVRKTVRTETEKAQEGADMREDAEWARDLSDKLDKTAEAITVIRAELKEITETGTTEEKTEKVSP